MHKRFNAALKRNLFELLNAISKRNAMNTLVKAAPQTSWSFFSYCYLSLFNDTLAHEIKVLDRHKDAAGFYYLLNCQSKHIKAFMKKHKLEKTDIDKLAAKLVIVRDKTHFHIDKDGVLDPVSFWKAADIKPDFINGIIDKLWLVLNDLFRHTFDHDFGQPIYEGHDVDLIINTVRKADITI